MNDTEFEQFLEMSSRMDAAQAEEFYRKASERYWVNLGILENMNAAEISRKLGQVAELIHNRSND
jgi:hypothetical protein